MFDLESLERYPKAPNLQAYNSADKLLLKRWYELGAYEQNTWVINDDFGALSRSTNATQSINDSWLSHRAMLNNGVAPATLLKADQQATGNCDIVLLKIPKQQAALTQQLRQLCAAIDRPVTILCAGMDKHLSPNTAKWIEGVLGKTTRHPGKSKARIFEATLSPLRQTLGDGAVSTRVPTLDKTLITLPGNFSSGAVDGGTRLLLEYLHLAPVVSRACDLACGNGVIGLHILLANQATEVLFADESSLAISSAKQNVAKCISNYQHRTHFHWGDGLLGVHNKFELIVCNPPFHQGHVMDAEIGKRLLRQCVNNIAENGELWVVANAHLPYGTLLKQSFTDVNVMARNKNYHLWRASSPRAS